MEIRRFRGEYAFLSNFYPVAIEFHGWVFPSVEHAYQAAKVGVTTELAGRIRKASTPREAKRLGRTGVPVTWWRREKILVMETLLRRKFAKPRLLAKLVRTHPKNIVEENDWGDRFWGVDLDGNGENHLGRLLMKIRDGARQ